MGQRNIDHWKTLPSGVVNTVTENASLCDSDFFKYSHKLLRVLRQSSSLEEGIPVQSPGRGMVDVESPVLEVES
jgi:hypothetical protein